MTNFQYESGQDGEGSGWTESTFVEVPPVQVAPAEQKVSDMNLRDHLAALAMEAFGSGVGMDADVTLVAQKSYQQADAMLVIRATDSPSNILFNAALDMSLALKMVEKRISELPEGSFTLEQQQQIRDAIAKATGGEAATNG